MENDIGPAYVKINYQTRWGIHSMSVPSVPLIAAVGDGAAPYFDLRGGEIDVSVATAIPDYVNKLKASFRTETNFIDYIVYSKPSVGDIPVPVYSAVLGIAGTLDGGTDDKASQLTLSFRATDFTLFRCVMLDAPTYGNYDKQTTAGTSGGLHDLVAYIIAPETWIASRGGGRPNTFLSLTKTKNEKLRRSYKMT